ncbi:MAG: hypothetical protein Q8R82_12810 [Hyphomonadaceae bacterium]|nr:hypothetical protein [Hyphomonadaceae bacterium]
MRRSLFGVSLSLAFTACGQPQAPLPAQQATVPPTEQTGAAPSSLAPTTVEGWETDLTAYARIGSTLTSFALKQPDGTELTQENLRDRWTILAFVDGNAANAKPESDYIAALNSAADQDPDLDFLAVRTAAPGTTLAAASPGAPWPTIDDTSGFAPSIRIESAPAYILVGPDLTIEGYRGALSATPDDGIKSVIRGVAEIRKQVAAPE